MTRLRAASGLLLALLAGAQLLSWVVAAGNFRVAEPSRDERLNQALAAIEPADERRLAARYLASESNRAMFTALGPAQLLLAALATACLLLERRRRPRPRERWPLVTMLGLLSMAAASALLVPAIIEQGRAIDFVAGPTPERSRFLKLHAIYMVLDACKVVAALALSFALVSPKSPRAERADRTPPA